MDRTEDRRDPVSGTEPSGTEPEGTPWERREQEGFLPGLLATVGLLVRHPRRAYRLVDPGGSRSDPVLFALSVFLAAMFLGEISDLVVGWWSGELEKSLAELPFGIEVGETSLTWLTAGGLGLAGCLFAVIVGIPFGVVFSVLLLFVGSGAVHAGAHLVRALGRSETGFRGTLAALAYASVGLLASALPWIGEVVGPPACLFLATVGLAELHRTSLPRAAAAVLLPPALLIATVLAFVAAGA